MRSMSRSQSCRGWSVTDYDSVLEVAALVLSVSETEPSVSMKLSS